MKTISIFQETMSPVKDIEGWRKKNPDSDFCLRHVDCLEVIKSYLNNRTSASQVTAWANMMEFEGVEYIQNDKSISNFVFAVATPEINGEVSENVTLTTYRKFKKLAQGQV